MDGYLKIKTKIDNKDVDKGITELEDKIKKLQADNANSSKEQDSLQQEINKYEELCNKADAYKQKIKELKEEKANFSSQFNGSIPDSQMSNYNLIQSQLESTQNKYKNITNEIDKQAPKIEKVYSKLDKVKAKQVENNNKITEFKQKIEQINLNKIQNGLDNVGKGIQKQIGKIGKMAMAVFGIRTAYNAVRSAINSVSQYNSQVSADFEYMRYCIANMLAPAVQWLVQLLYTALSYVNAIASAWFGINLFSNSSAKAFQKMQKSASGTAKSAKEIQKSLQGFDEMNILQDNSNNDYGSGGISTPSMDLSAMQGEAPEWLKWIIDNKDLILSVMTGIISGLLAFKALNLAASLGLIKNELLGIKALGIGTLIAGIVYTVQSLMKYLENPTFTNLGGSIQGIGVAIVGLALIISNLPLAVVGAIVLIWGTIVKYWDQIKSFFQSGINWLTSKSDWIREMFGDTIGDIYDNFVKALQDILNWVDKMMNGIKSNFNEIISFVKNIFAGNWEGAWQNIKNIFSNIWNGMKDTVGMIFSLISKMAINIGTTVGSTIAGAFKAVVNGVLWAIENILNKPIRTVNSLIGVINKVPGINLGYLSTFNLPRLAKGGVISQPTTAIIGEAGKEAVVPLENNMEWLDVLATKISNKIGNGDASFILNIDSRTVQRGIARRQQELAFAKNGR